MKLLAIDSSTHACSVALWNESELLQHFELASREHTQRILPLVDKLLAEASSSLSSLDAIAFTCGPGSFTGLRIGISTVKGLAWSLNKPVVGISSLDALAWQCIPAPYPVCAMLDARKQEVYYGRYRFQDGEFKKDRSEQVIAPVEAINDIREPCLFIGNGANLYKEEIQEKLGELAHFAGGNRDIIRASSVAGLSFKRFVDHQTDDVASLVPHYIRKSDAELYRKKDNLLKL